MVRHGVPMVPCDVAETRHHTQTLRDLAVHRSVHVVEQVEGLRYQLVTLRYGARLDLVLAGRVEVVGVWSLEEKSEI